MFDLRFGVDWEVKRGDSDGGQKIIFTGLFIVEISGEIWFRTYRIYITRSFSLFIMGKRQSPVKYVITT